MKLRIGQVIRDMYSDYEMEIVLVEDTAVIYRDILGCWSMDRQKLESDIAKGLWSQYDLEYECLRGIDREKL
jgi:hypothetical protein